MKLKSLLFGSAAVLAAGTGAQAADLPTVEPVDYVRICDAFNESGYFYIPGSDVCLKIGGYVRVQSGFVDGDNPDLVARYGVAPSEVNNWTTAVRGHVEFTAKQQADIGLITTFIGLEGTRGGRNTTPPFDGVGGYATNFGISDAFVQVANDWGTFTAGKIGSRFDFWGSNGYGFRLGIEDGTTDPNLVAWTFAGGNGFSFTVSAEDPDSVGRRRDGDDDYEGLEAPDGVANVRVDQGWGSAQLMGAVRQIHDVNGDGLGFAVGGGLSINVPGGWRFDSQAGYSEGAVAYISSDIGGIGDFDGPTGDEANESWAARAGISGPIMAKLTAWAEGSFIHAEEDDNGDDYDFWGFEAGVKYAATSNLKFGPEFEFNSLDGDDPGDDYDLWAVSWRLQNNF